MLFIIKKLSRRLVVFAAFILSAICLLAFINAGTQVNYAMTQWNLNNKNLQFMDLKNDSKSIQRLIEKINDEQTILNDERYEPLQNDSIVIVIQVHKRMTYLMHLIESLSNARDISKTLLIFSHDYYDEEINELVQSIDFCRVMQIFYPYSIQTHPKDFPGDNAHDCRRDIKKSDAIRLKCNNALFSDKFGHYRESKFTQMKHHYWWKLNRIFDELIVTRNMKDMLLLLLEEDYMIAPDFLHVLNLLKSLSKNKCSYCNMLALGTYSEGISGENYFKVCHAIYLIKDFKNFFCNIKVEISPWITSKHNMGMAFNRTTWNEIKSCAKYFCTYDDYNYDWSIQNVNYNCLASKLYVMISKSPRVFHIGECDGMHHHNSVNCDSSQVIKNVHSMLNYALKGKKLFPKRLKVTRVYDEEDRKDNLNENGGWGDIRDHLLCLNMTLGLR